MALVPLLWCLVRREERSAWWWIAGAFFVSWLADGATLIGYPTWIPATVYPVSQAAIVTLVLASRREAATYIGLLVVVGIVTVLTEGVTGPTLFLETVAAGIVVGVVWDKPLGFLRWTLLVAFGIGWLAWVGYVIAPGWTSWSVYQAVRAVSLVMFCWASVRPHPALRLA